jgi:hypothetical protein
MKKALQAIKSVSIFNESSFAYLCFDVGIMKAYLLHYRQAAIIVNETTSNYYNIDNNI